MKHATKSKMKKTKHHTKMHEEKMEHMKVGGHVKKAKKKMEHKVHGEHAKMHLGKKSRKASGGEVGSNEHPLSTANRVTERPGFAASKVDREDD